MKKDTLRDDCVKQFWIQIAGLIIWSSNYCNHLTISWDFLPSPEQLRLLLEDILKFRTDETQYRIGINFEAPVKPFHRHPLVIRMKQRSEWEVRLEFHR